MNKYGERDKLGLVHGHERKWRSEDKNHVFTIHSVLCIYLQVLIGAAIVSRLRMELLLLCQSSCDS